MQQKLKQILNKFAVSIGYKFFSYLFLQICCVGDNCYSTHEVHGGAVASWKAYWLWCCCPANPLSIHLYFRYFWCFVFPIFIKKFLLKENLFIVFFTLGKHPLVPSTRVPTDEMRSGLSQSPPTLEKPRQPRPPYSELTQFPRCVTFYCQFSSLFALAPQN